MNGKAGAASGMKSTRTNKKATSGPFNDCYLIIKPGL